MCSHCRTPEACLCPPPPGEGRGGRGVGGDPSGGEETEGEVTGPPRRQRDPASGGTAVPPPGAEGLEGGARCEAGYYQEGDLERRRRCQQAAGSSDPRPHAASSHRCAPPWGALRLDDPWGVQGPPFLPLTAHAHIAQGMDSEGAFWAGAASVM
jgi:hypothetical protein